MIYIALFILAFAAIQLLVALSNLIFRPGLKEQYSETHELVSVMIPARNEEANILKILTDLQHQTHSTLEILVYDDQSTDRTASLVLDMARYDKRIKLISSQELPEGWLGKNHACYQMSQQATGKYFLFVDADVRLGENAISTTLQYLNKSKSVLLSAFPRQIMQTPGERMVVPVMNYILMTLLPLILVRYSRFPSLAAANGQFMLFNADTYREQHPHLQMKSEKVEDIRIARWFKSKKLSVACIPGNKEINCRMYSGYSEAINGFSKNIVMFFGNSYTLAFMFWLITTFGFVVLLLAMPLIYFWLYVLAAILIRIAVSIASRQSVYSNILGIIPQQYNMGRLLFLSLKYKKQGSYEWKGRKIK